MLQDGPQGHYGLGVPPLVMDLGIPGSTVNFSHKDTQRDTKKRGNKALGNKA